MERSDASDLSVLAVLLLVAVGLVADDLAALVFCLAAGVLDVCDCAGLVLAPGRLPASEVGGAVRTVVKEMSQIAQCIEMRMVNLARPVVTFIFRSISNGGSCSGGSINAVWHRTDQGISRAGVGAQKGSGRVVILTISVDAES